MKLDTEKSGLNAIWKLHEVGIIEDLINHGERKTSDVLVSLEFHEVKVSRSTVGNFLNKLVELGLATVREEGGMGGSHGLYTLIEKTWADFDNVIVDKFLYALWEIFPNNDRITYVLRGIPDA